MTEPPPSPDAQPEHFAAWARAVDQHNALQDLKLDTLSGIVREIKSDVRVVERDLHEFRNETFARFDGMDRRFEGVDARFDAVDTRFDKVESMIQQVLTLVGGTPSA